MVGVDCDDYDGAGNASARILLGPATGRPALMPLGLAYHVEYAMDFGYRVGIEDLCELLDGVEPTQSGGGGNASGNQSTRVVVAYVDPVNGTVGPDTDPGGRTVSESIPAVGLQALAAALALVLAVARRSAWNRMR